ncbi:zinc finger protein 62-like protein [Anopheles sinensis]|uniref:Zinc finger protein 62-like protein n=1 Tax=Anopheles sinensis TaxID=74873 RepID=A0A084W5R8_ANOSI|nr:zinc finger protein 62-like protein [Anopheles sinensis]
MEQLQEDTSCDAQFDGSKKPLCGREKPFSCDICGRRYQTNASLKTHKLTHQHGKKELCGFCGARFANRGQLKVHERVHTGEKPYKCDQCDKAFSYRESLITHSTIHTGVKPFCCSCCGAQFSCVGNLIKHRKLRPKSCGLPEYNPTARVAPRPTKRTMPSLSDRKQYKKSLKTLQPAQHTETKSVPDTATASPDRLPPTSPGRDTDEVYLQSGSDGEEAIEPKSPTRTPTYILDTAEIVQHGETIVLEYETVEVLDEFIKYDDQDDQEVFLKEIDKEEGMQVEVIRDVNSCEQNIDSEEQTVGNGECNISPNSEEISGFEETAQEKLVSTEHMIMVLKSKANSSTGYEINYAMRPETSVLDEQGKQTDNLQYKEPFDDEITSKTGTVDPSDCIEKTVESQLNIAEIDGEQKSDPKDNLSNASDKVLPEVEFSAIEYETTEQKTHSRRSIQGKPNLEMPQITAEELDKMAIERQDMKLQEQLETVRQNSEVSSNMYYCKLCPLQYTTEYLMARHLERVHHFQLEQAREKLQFTKKTVHVKQYRCKYCNRSYVNAARLKTHLFKHGTNGQLVHKCPACAQYFETKEMARQHALELHRGQLVCDTCGKECQDPERLQQHVRYAHKGMKELRRQKYVCQRCGKCVPSRTVLSDHDRTNCGQSPIYRCESCGKNYASFASLKVHQTMHQNLPEPYECGFCRKRFRHKGQLKIHERSHTGEKPFRCQHCPKSFPYRESLLVHQSTHTGIKRFACSGCGRTFSCIANLQAHRRSHQATCGAVPNNTKPLRQKEDS